METVTLPVESLKPYKLNARRHTDYQIDRICESIEEYGFNDPIGVWGEENLIVEGHGRLMAAKRLGMTEVPCIRLDHLTEEQRKEYSVNHNHTNDLSSWDWGKLKRDLDDIQLEKLHIEVPDLDKMGASQGDRAVEKITPPIIYPVTVMIEETDHLAFEQLKDRLGFKKDIDVVRYMVQFTGANVDSAEDDEDDEEGDWDE